MHWIDKSCIQIRQNVKRNESGGVSVPARYCCCFVEKQRRIDKRFEDSTMGDGQQASNIQRQAQLQSDNKSIVR